MSRIKRHVHNIKEFLSQSTKHLPPKQNNNHLTFSKKQLAGGLSCEVFGEEVLFTSCRYMQLRKIVLLLYSYGF